MKKTLFFAALLFLIQLGFTQDIDDENQSVVSFEAQLVNRYIWRGLDIAGNMPFVHPCIELNLGSEKHAVTLGLWGAYSIGKQFDEELDLYLTYTFKEMFELTVTDYFLYDNSPTGYDLFNYKDGETPHMIEGMIGFAGTEKFPVSLQFAMILYGADARKINSDGTEGGIIYSKYIELGYEKELKGSTMTLFLGAVPDKANEDMGEETFYGTTAPGIINVGCSFEKELKISNQFSCVMNAGIITNPVEKSAFMVVGLTF